jgi:hypothetical protein
LQWSLSDGSKPIQDVKKKLIKKSLIKENFLKNKNTITRQNSIRSEDKELVALIDFLNEFFENPEKKKPHHAKANTMQQGSQNSL